MMEEVWSILQILSAALSIIVLLIMVPSCLLICCCCRKHQGTLEKDLKDIARNHNILQNGDADQSQYKQLPSPKQKRIQNVQRRPVTAKVSTVEDEVQVPPPLDDDEFNEDLQE